jgi:hypothetical protein
MVLKRERGVGVEKESKGIRRQYIKCERGVDDVLN